MGSIQAGVVALLVYSLAITGQLVINKAMEDLGWPIWYVLAACELICLPVFFAALVLSGAEWPAWLQVKWVFLRAFFVVLSFVLAIIAVGATGAPGDVNALTSINVVAASAIGHVFLSEHLRWMHTFAIAASIVGTTLVSRPAFIFGGVDGSAALLLGYGSAVLSGFVRAIALACARKCGKVPVPFMAVSTTMVSSLVFLTLPRMPGAKPQLLDTAYAEPWIGVGVVGANVVLSILALVMGSYGSMLCPAAVSATVFTAAGMVFGYLFQTLLFHVLPDALTLLGAGLMLLSVAIMAGFRTRPATAAAADAEQQSDAPAASDASDTESILSFVASEFAEFEAHSESRTDSIRLRRQTTAPQRIGAEASRPSPAEAVLAGARVVLPAVAPAIS